MPEENQADDKFIYERLVNHPSSKDETIFGALAYAKYQIEKKRWFANINTPNPSSEQIAAFYAHYDDDKLHELTEFAQVLVLDYAERHANKRLSHELERYKIEVLSVEFKKNKVNFWMSVWQGFLGSAAFTIFLFLAGVVVSQANPNSNMTRLFQFLFSPDQYDLKRIEPKNQSLSTPSKVTPEKNSVTK